MEKLNDILRDVMLKSNIRNQPKLRDNIDWDETHISGKNHVLWDPTAKNHKDRATSREVQCGVAKERMKHGKMICW